MGRNCEEKLKRLNDLNFASIIRSELTATVDVKYFEYEIFQN